MGEEHAAEGGTPWLKIILISCAVIIVLAGACGATMVFLGREAYEKAKLEGIRQQRPIVMQNLETDDYKDQLNDRFDQIISLANDKKLTTVAFAIAVQAIGESIKGDQNVSDEEAQIMIKYFDIIIEKQGDIPNTDPGNEALVNSMLQEFKQAK